MKVFLGKFSNKYPEQIKKRYYAAGDENSSSYGDIKPDDYVFIAYNGKIVALWKAKEYTKMKNVVNQKDDGVLLFEEVKTYKDVSVSNDFTRCKYFVHDLNLVNKVTKSVKGLGFIPIKTTKNSLRPEEIEFKVNLINIYISLNDVDLNYKEGDIKVAIDNLEQMKITGIFKFVNGEFVIYDELNNLYEERNKQDGKFTIKELKDYAIKDNANNKRKFLITLIEELESKGYMKISNAIKLYDNLLVGRKRTATKKSVENSKTDISDEDVLDDEIGEDSEEYVKYASLLNFNPNLILYGPPGTGKTYATQKIIDSFEKKYFKDKSSYKIAESENRVKNITFHQSYSYEEFIEGIRPVFNNEDASNIGYKLENGLFKEHCINAEKGKRQRIATYKLVTI